MPAISGDLTPMYQDDAAWEAELATLDDQVNAMTAFAGTLKDAVFHRCLSGCRYGVGAQAVQPVLLCFAAPQ